MWIIQRISTLLIVIYVCIGFGYAQIVFDECTTEQQKFRCHNGDCISGTLLCDGKADCRDSSDETEAECKQISCSTFRCDYGGCIDKDKACDGKRDCVDNSDETKCCRGAVFRCNDGQCIKNTQVCDGNRDCADGSDESAQCAITPPCPGTTFRCAYGACIDGDLKCNGVENCADGSDEKVCGGGWITPFTPTPTRQPPTETTRRTTPPISSGTNRCRAPPQPQNGRWKLHRSLCPNEQECYVSEGTELVSGSHLIYSCNLGYKIRGPTDVSCSFEGKWLNIPVCIEIRCKALTSASIEARCSTYDDEWISCESSVPPRTKATLQCQNSYRPETNLLSGQRRNVRCNTNGEWEPDPMRCVPGPLTINIYFNDTKLAFHTTLDRNNATLIEVLDDKVIIHTNTKDPNYPNIDVRIPKRKNNVAREPWTWS